MKICQAFFLMMTLLGCVLSQSAYKCQPSQDLVVNGGFERNQCSAERLCVWNNSTSFRPEFLPGWTPYPEVELGRSNIYNSNFKSLWVV